jgi:uncharacterized membrane protein YphA (DoxX/SURF4 family)
VSIAASASYPAALLSAGVLLWAGVAKLSRPLGTAASFAGLGLPAPRVLSRAVPFAELATAAALVVAPRVGAVAALALLASFTVVLVVALRGGVEVGCACFGSARARPVSVHDVARNVGLAALAVVAIGAEEPTVPGIDGVIAVTSAFVLGTVALALADLRRRVGAVWSNRLPGEPLS